MLISEKINQLDKILANIETNHSHSKSDLYAHINHDLAHITSALSANIKQIENNLNSKIITEQREFQEVSGAWFKDMARKTNEAIKKQTSEEYNLLLEKLAKEISTAIDKEVSEEIEKLHTTIDINKIIENLKNTPFIVNRIIDNAVKAVYDSINKDNIKSDTEAQLFTHLKDTIDLNAIIKAALETKALNDNILIQVKNKTSEIINNHIDKEYITNEIDTILKNLKESNEYKSKELLEKLEALKVQTQTDLLTLREDTEDDLNSLRNETNTNLTNLRNETQDGLHTLRNDTENKIEDLRQETQKKLEETHEECLIYAEEKKQEINQKVNFTKAQIDTLLEDTKQQVKTYTQDVLEELTQNKEEANADIAEELNYFNDNLSNLSNKAENDLIEMQEEHFRLHEEYTQAFKEYLESRKEPAVQEIIKIIVDSITENVEAMEYIKSTIINKGYDYLMQYEEELKEAIENLVKEYMINYFIEDDRLKNAMFSYQPFIDMFHTQAYEATKDRLTHACVKDFVKEALREEAKIILKNDFLQQAEAEAQAHLVLFQMQSGLNSITECLAKLESQYDINHKLDILLEKEKIFNETLQNAKDELKAEFKDPNLLGDSFKDYVKDSINDYDKTQDAETDGKIKTLQTELLALMQDLQNELDSLLIDNGVNGNSIIDIAKNIKELKEQITELEAKDADTTHEIETQNKKLNEMDVRIDTQNQNLLDFKTETEAKTQELESKITNLKDETEAKTQELDNKSQELANKTQDIETKTMELETKATDLETKTQELETKATDLETKTQELETKSEELEKKTNDLDGQINTAGPNGANNKYLSWR